MIKLTKPQRKALHQVWLRHMQPESRTYINVDWGRAVRTGKLTLHNPNGCEGVHVPDTPSYREFRKSVCRGDYGCIMANTYRSGLHGGMWLGIESDGHTHS